MTILEKYDLLLREIAILLDEKNKTISFQKYQLSSLEKALKDAESENAKIKTENKHTLEIR